MPRPYPHIPESGPRLTRALAPLTRDSAAYWEHRPADHNLRGFFVGGPEEPVPPVAQHARLVRSRCFEPTEGREGALQRMERERRHRLEMIERRSRFLASIGFPVRC